MRKNISTNTPSENKAGYSRAVLIKNNMYVSGTTSIDQKGNTIGSTVYDQTKYCIEKIKYVVEREGFSLKDVITVRAFLINMQDLDGFDKAFKEFFFETKPTCTIVGINALVKEDLLIEIECQLAIG